MPSHRKWPLIQVITALNADDFGAWEEKDFAPESDFLEKVRPFVVHAIPSE